MKLTRDTRRRLTECRDYPTEEQPSDEKLANLGFLEMLPPKGAKQPRLARLTPAGRRALEQSQSQEDRK